MNPSVIIPITYPYRTYIKQVYLLTESDVHNSIGHVYQLSNGWKAYKLGLQELFAYLEKNPLSYININKIVAFPGTRTNESIFNLNREPKWYIGYGSEFNDYVKAAKEVKSNNVFIPHHIMDELCCRYIKGVELKQADLKVYQIIQQEEFVASMVVVSGGIRHKNSQGEIVFEHYPMRLNKHLDGWSDYGKMSCWPKEKKAQIISSHDGGKIIQFDYRSFVVSTIFNLLGERISGYENMGEKKDVLTVLYGDYLFDDISYPPAFKILMTKEQLTKICMLKRKVIEDSKIGYIENPFGYQIKIPPDTPRKNIFAYYIRSVQAFVVKAAMGRVTKTLAKEFKGKALVLGVIWDSILVDISKELVDNDSGICNDAIKRIGDVMGKPLREYGYVWYYDVSMEALND